MTSPASARTALGTYDGWGAFRDERPLRCYAIAEPVRGSGGHWRPFAAVGTWPGSGVRGQIHIRLDREVLSSAPVTLTIGDRRFVLVASGVDAWAPDGRSDAGIVAMMRSATSMSIEARSSTGAGFAQAFVLKGAASAMDAASLGCVRSQ